jgi:hypothetical protein
MPGDDHEIPLGLLGGCACCGDGGDGAEFGIQAYPCDLVGTKAGFTNGMFLPPVPENGLYYMRVDITGSGTVSWNTAFDNPDENASVESSCDLAGSYVLDEPVRITLNGDVLINPQTTWDATRESETTYTAGPLYSGPIYVTSSGTEDETDFRAGHLLAPPAGTLITGADHWTDPSVFSTPGTVTNATSYSGAVSSRSYSLSVPAAGAPTPVRYYKETAYSIEAIWSDEITDAMIQTALEDARAELEADLPEKDWWADAGLWNGLITQSLSAGYYAQGKTWDAPFFRACLRGVPARHLAIRYRWRWVPDEGDAGEWTDAMYQGLLSAELDGDGEPVLVSPVLAVPGFANDFPEEFGQYQVRVVRAKWWI